MDKQVGTPKTISRMNKRLIMNALLQDGPNSRADLVKKLHISFPSLSANVRDLIALGLIREGSVGNQNSIGRNSTLIYANDAYSYVAGIEVDKGTFKIAIAKFNGEIIRYETVKFAISDRMAVIVDQLVEAIGRITRDLPDAQAKLKTIALGMHGVHNLAKSKNYLQLQDMTPIETEIAKRLNVHVIVDNDVNMAVLGERWKLGWEATYRNIVYVTVGGGIGAGILINGELYNGVHNAAGEFGNMLFFPPDRNDSPDRIPQDLETIIGKLNDPAQPGLTALQIDYLSMAMVNLIAVLNPELIVIGGPDGEKLMGYRERILPFVEKYIPTSLPDVVASRTKDRATVYGAISTALDYARNDIFSNL